MPQFEHPVVAKFGGTSMAHPELVEEQLGFENDAAGTVIVSAPGKDTDFPVKATDMLLGYGDSFTSHAIQDRFQILLDHGGQAQNPDSQAVIDAIPQDLQDWSGKDAVAALGEYWSAKLFAAQTGRTFVDARDIILFDGMGMLDEPATFAAAQERLGDGGRYVVPGFYGSRPDGSIKTFERGGSDITGALVARALHASEYHNWSDVDGFMTADPRKVSDAQLLDTITYRESRELGNGGSELLHRTVIRYLGGSGVKTVMRKTAGEPGNAGTEIVDARVWTEKPIIGVTGRDDLMVLNLHEFGLNEGVGETLDIIQALKDENVPYEHSNDATDDVSIYLSKEHRDVVAQIAKRLKHPGRTLMIQEAGLIHVVGEGLAQSSSLRFRTLGAVCTAFADAGIECQGVSDAGGSATQTLFIRPEDLKDAVSIAHQALALAK